VYKVGKVRASTYIEQSRSSFSSVESLANDILYRSQRKLEFTVRLFVTCTETDRKTERQADSWTEYHSSHFTYT